MLLSGERVQPFSSEEWGSVPTADEVGVTKIYMYAFVASRFMIPR
jgi:hypothetical protein